MNNLEELKKAAELANEVDPEAKVFIYAYLDKDVKKYVIPFINEKEPAYMVSAVRNSILKGQKKELTGLALCFLGTFELTKGVHELFDEPQVLIDCDVAIEKLGGLADGKERIA